MRPAKTQSSLGIRPFWSESSLSPWRKLGSLATHWMHSEDSDQTGRMLSAWRKLGSLATHWMHSEDSDQTGRMPRLIWVFTGRIVTLLVLSWGGSNRSHISLPMWGKHCYIWNKLPAMYDINKYSKLLDDFWALKSGTALQNFEHNSLFICNWKHCVGMDFLKSKGTFDLLFDFFFFSIFLAYRRRRLTRWAYSIARLGRLSSSTLLNK